MGEPISTDPLTFGYVERYADIEVIISHFSTFMPHCISPRILKELHQDSK